MSNWNDCVLLEDGKNIISYFKNMNNVLFIMGKGFDPRSCTILKIIIPVVKSSSVWMIDYNDKLKNENENNESRSQKNYSDFLNLCKDIKHEEYRAPLYGNSDSKNTLIISESVRILFDNNPISNYKHIIIDISAMPRGVSFSIIKRILNKKTDAQKIYILVCENCEFDDIIKPNHIDETAEYLPGFNTFSMSMESDNDEKTIWFPILGMNDEKAFSIICNYLKPVEICPIVPFPSSNIRRGENILRKYGQLLFRENGIEKRNVIYVPEKNPILVYQKLYETVKYYEKALNNAPGDHSIKYAFSSQSSKLIDIGMLMAVIDLNNNGIKTGIVVVKNQGYDFSAEKYDESQNKIFCLCLDESEFNW
jgi:hypothetical protein